MSAREWSEEARHPEQTAMDVIERALGEMGESVDRVVVVGLDRDGYKINFYSNARSEAEMNGMLWMALNYQENLNE